MANGNEIRNDKVRNDISKEAAGISALLWGKIDKHEYIKGEEILPFDQSRIIEQGKFTYSPLRKAFGRQIQTIESQDEKQIKATEEHVKQLAESNAHIRKQEYHKKDLFNL